MSQIIQKFLIAGGAIGLVVLGYMLFVRPNQFELEGGSTNALADSVLAKTQVFIARRAQLDSVSIDGSLFTDPRFTSLRSYSVGISDQSLGKTSLFELPPALAETDSSDE